MQNIATLVVVLLVVAVVCCIDIVVEVVVVVVVAVVCCIDIAVVVVVVAVVVVVGIDMVVEMDKTVEELEIADMTSKAQVGMHLVADNTLDCCCSDMKLVDRVHSRGSLHLNNNLVLA
jgi:hypothetical protein